MGTARNVIMGAATLYQGSFGAVEPTDAAFVSNAVPAASAWGDMGFTNDGVTININQDFSSMEVDQIADVVASRMTKRIIQVKTNLAEATLENLVVGLNSGTVATGTGYKTYDPATEGTEMDPNYKALILVGNAPANAAGVAKRRMFIIRKALNVENVEAPYKKGDQTLYPVTFQAHYVDPSIKPFHIVDQT